MFERIKALYHRILGCTQAEYASLKSKLEGDFQEMRLTLSADFNKVQDVHSSLDAKIEAMHAAAIAELRREYGALHERLDDREKVLTSDFALVREAMVFLANTKRDGVGTQNYEKPTLLR